MYGRIKLIKKIMYIVVLTLMIQLTNAQQLNINDYIKLVEKNNFDIQLTDKDEQTAEKQISKAWTNIYPQLNANLDGKHYLKNDKPVFTKNEITGGVQLNQTIFDAAKFKSVSAEKDLFESVKYSAQDTKERIILNAKKAFYYTILLKEVWKVKKETEELARSQYDFVKEKFDNGLANEFELLQAELQWKRNIPDVSNAKKDFVISVNELKDLAGISDSTNIEITGELKNDNGIPEFPVIKSVLSKRPDYQSLIWEREASKSALSAVKSEFLPTLNGYLDYTYFRNTDKFVTGDKTTNFTAGLSLNIPIFQGGNRIVRMQEAAIEKEKSLIKINRFEKLLYTELMSIFENLKVANDNLSTSQVNVDVAEKAFELANESYQNGLATQLDLQDARNSLSQSKLDLLNASFEFISSKLDWKKAVGY